MINRSLGAAGPNVSALGLGCMGMSDLYGPSDRAESITIAWVLARGADIVPLVGARRRDRLLLTGEMSGRKLSGADDAADS